MLLRGYKFLFFPPNKKYVSWKKCGKSAESLKKKLFLDDFLFAKKTVKKLLYYGKILLFSGCMSFRIRKKEIVVKTLDFIDFFINEIISLGHVCITISSQNSWNTFIRNLVIFLVSIKYLALGSTPCNMTLFQSIYVFMTWFCVKIWVSAIQSIILVMQIQIFDYYFINSCMKDVIKIRNHKSN